MALLQSQKYRAEQASKYTHSEESDVNKRFFDTHANIGVLDNVHCNNRDLIQCPLFPNHRFAFRRIRHIEFCSRANDVKLEECSFNPFHHFRKEDEAEHYRFCSTFLLLKRRFKDGWPSYLKYENHFRRYALRRWSMDEFYAVYKELGREPLDSNLVPDPKKKWYERDTDLYQFGITGTLLADLSEDVIEAAEKLDLETRSESRPLPNFYGTRAPRLILPEVHDIPAAPVPIDVPKNGVHRKTREQFDFTGWLETEPQKMTKTDYMT